ncbi:MAG: hypothetical protein ACOY0T_16510 [Myxococcota bacterium]
MKDELFARLGELPPVPLDPELSRRVLQRAELELTRKRSPACGRREVSLLATVLVVCVVQVAWLVSFFGQIHR